MRRIILLVAAVALQFGASEALNDELLPVGGPSDTRYVEGWLGVNCTQASGPVNLFEIRLPAGNSQGKGLKLTGPNGTSSYLQAINSTSASDGFYPFLQSKATPGCAWGLFIQAIPGQDTYDSLNSGITLQVNKPSGGAVTNTNIFRVKNYNTTLFVVSADGNVGIGTLNRGGTFKLAVNGKIRAKEIKVETNWADFVFKDGYNLKSLDEVEKFIQTNKHLPEIPSEKEVKENGINVGEMNAKLLQKIEELTLYVIELKKDNDNMKAGLAALQKEAK